LSVVHVSYSLKDRHQLPWSFGAPARRTLPHHNCRSWSAQFQTRTFHTDRWCIERSQWCQKSIQQGRESRRTLRGRGCTYLAAGHGSAVSPGRCCGEMSNTKAYQHEPVDKKCGRCWSKIRHCKAYTIQTADFVRLYPVQLITRQPGPYTYSKRWPEV
jgi:hypothetical protein